MPHHTQRTSEPIRIRPFRAADLSDVLSLNADGVIVGGGAPDADTSDFTDMVAAYFQRPHDHFWVAEARGQLVGTIGVVEQQRHVSIVRRLRVARTWQDTDLAPRLIRAALEHCRRHGALKVILDTPCRPHRCVRVLGELGFQYTRTRDQHGRHLIEFYLNLYEAPARPHDAKRRTTRAPGHAGANGGCHDNAHQRHCAGR